MFLAYLIFVQLRREYTDGDAGIIIVYNRVPKCGSTLLVRIFQILSNRTRAFTFRQSQELRHYRYSSEEQHTLVTDLVRYSYNGSYQRIVYEQHFHFVNLPSTSKNIFYYINQLRDPLERTLSEFDFERYIGGSSGAGHANLFLHPSLRNLTMDECVSTGDPTRCLTKLYGVYSPISFFCGQSSFCDDTVTRPTSDAALSQAKSNIERYYIHIGILEYIQSSLELLEHIQPSIFTGVQIQTDEESWDYCRKATTTLFHPAGTCKMGNVDNDNMAVVNSQLKVKGIKNLRIADTSVFPTMISVNPCITCMMTGEKCADMIKQD
ncbi:unnamed protein product [Adineta steineri]|uniref:Glucose-methanol-choline oxidoreductase C-terminal domain-containing protein n=1 Tax=Adineta steineri TaxID=433720 RepID=A0A820BIU1_9BILA|nr:unnamed protein product [Adineta steineri]CAF4199526.1 unnamed protein product [Adineta steineri]